MAAKQQNGGAQAQGKAQAKQQQAQAKAQKQKKDTQAKQLQGAPAEDKRVIFDIATAIEARGNQGGPDGTAVGVRVDWQALADVLGIPTLPGSRVPPGAAGPG